jgi:hypothetical protein
MEKLLKKLDFKNKFTVSCRPISEANPNLFTPVGATTLFGPNLSVAQERATCGHCHGLSGMPLRRCYCYQC